MYKHSADCKHVSPIFIYQIKATVYVYRISTGIVLLGSSVLTSGDRGGEIIVNLSRWCRGGPC